MGDKEKARQILEDNDLADFRSVFSVTLPFKVD